ncbi:MAG: hypothetical protein ACR2JJ_03285 [Sphingomicrobium sp.]
MAKNNQRGRNNNNAEGHNQYTNDWMDAAKDRPFTSAAAAAGAVAAGAFLWSRRNQISDQISRLSGQITDWAEDMRSSNSSRELAMTEGPNESSAIESSRATAARRSAGTKSGNSGNRSTGSRGSTGSSARQMSETGGGNASIGAHTGSGPGATTGAGPRA